MQKEASARQPFGTRRFEFDEHPRDFLGSDYAAHLKEARRRIFRTIRFLEPTPFGDGLNVEVDKRLPTLEILTDFLDDEDARRSMQVRKQRGNRRPTLGGKRHLWIRSPQKMKHRRRALFSLDDLDSTDIVQFDDVAIKAYAYEPFLDWMRWCLFHDVLKEMVAAHDLALIDGVWYLSMQALDEHIREIRNVGRRRVKRDDRSYHGKTNSHRNQGKQIGREHAKRDRMRAAA